MADGVILNAGAGGVTAVTDDCGAAGHAQVVKLAIATDGSATLIPADATNGLLVDAARVIPGTAATALGKAEDAAHTTGDTGVLMLAVRRDAAAVGSDTDGDNSTLNVNSSGRLYTTAVVDTALPAGTNNIGDVDVLSLPAIPAGTNNIGDVDVLTVPAPLSTTGGGTEATALRVTIASNSTGVLSVDDNGGSLTVDGTVTANLAAGTNNIGDVDVLTMPNVTLAAGTNTNEVVGDAAHDTAVAGNPVLIGGYATNSIEGLTQVAAGDAARIVVDLNGVLVTRPHTTPEETISERVADTGGTSTAFTNFGAVASVRNFVTSVTIWNSSATDGYVDLRDGAAGSIIATLPAPQTGGGHFVFPVPLRTTANTALAYDVSGAITTVYITVVGYQAKG